MPFDTNYLWESAEIAAIVAERDALRAHVERAEKHIECQTAENYLLADCMCLEYHECVGASATIATLEAEVGALRAACIHIYNSGYHAGHHYTVEGGYVDIHSNDMDSYHAEEVAELLAALAREEGK